MRNQLTRPVDSAGLLLIRGATGGPEVLLGPRRRTARAFPGEYVFPGGVVEPVDACASGFPEPVPMPAGGLDRTTRARLRVFARTALRECYEETGLLLETGSPPGDRAESPHGAPVWQAYADAGTPAVAGRVKYYLPTGVNSCGEGDSGLTSVGILRDAENERTAPSPSDPHDESPLSSPRTLP